MYKRLITALYCRLSQEDAAEGASNSILHQKKLLLKFAKDRGFLHPKFYIDEGFSGANFERPGFREMMAHVEKGMVGVVIVKDQSRLGRDYLRTGMLMEMTFPQYDVRFIAINDGVDSINGLGDFTSIKNYFNDFYARDTSRKVRAVHLLKNQRRERVGATLPFGYQKNPAYQKFSQTEPMMIVDPKAAEIVKYIFALSLEGLGIMKIRDRLQEEQIPTPSTYRYRLTGKARAGYNPERPYNWIHTTVRSILGNQVYCGDTVNFKTYSKSHKLKKRLKNAPDKVAIHKDTHEAIIDRQTFELVQKHFEGRNGCCKSTGLLDKFAGYLFCNDCKKRLYLHRQKEQTQRNFYSCGGFRSKVTECTAHCIRENTLDAIVLDRLQKVVEFAAKHPKQFYRQAAEKCEIQAQMFRQAAEAEKERIIDRIEEIEYVFRCLYEDKTAGRLSEERFDMLACGFDQERKHLHQLLSEIERQIVFTESQDKSIHEFIAQAKKHPNITALTPEIIRTFIRRIDVGERAKKYSRKEQNPIYITFSFQLPKELFFEQCPMTENFETA